MVKVGSSTSPKETSSSQTGYAPRYALAKKTQNAFRQFYLGMHSDVLQPGYALGRVCVGQGMRRPRYASARVCGNQGMRQPGYAPTMVCAVQGMRQPKYAPARLPSILDGFVEE